MLIQPLVENAIQHGIEPSVEGGEIHIRGAINTDVLRVEVADNGIGITMNRKNGIGLANIRDRLSAMYGLKGRLILEENSPSGLNAIIEVPYNAD